MDSRLLDQTFKNGLTIIWNDGGDALFNIDEVNYEIKNNQIFFLTELHSVRTSDFSSLRLIRFNRNFYCPIDHDADVGCKGMLFFGASKVPIVTIPDEEHEKFELLWQMFVIEMQSKDSLQAEMLQVMLKRLLILCTRLFKKQMHVLDMPVSRLNIIREYNFLVETFFKQHHDVAFYASQLNRSPKSISNYFASIGNVSPLQLIHDRIMLEAKRLLRHTDKPVKEIAYMLGYEDIQSFSRFFKSKESISPVDYRSRTN